ncbi:CCA tRNA nucleotidyltransferase [Chloroflexota bacterium]
MTSAKADLKEPFSSLIGSKVWLLLTKVSNFLAEQDIKSYVVGGLVRDVLLRRDTADIDLAVATDALQIAPKVAAALGGKYVLLDRVNRVGRVVLVDKEIPATKVQWEIDFSTFEGSIEQDLARRDFTIDAMAIDLSQLRKDFADVQLIDPFSGLDDLHRGVVRVVAETAFESDAARLLRAVRLAAELGFSIDKKSESLIRSYSHLVASVAGERVREELLWLLAISNAGQFLPYLDELGLLMELFPELAETKGVTQPKEHFWDVFDHSLKTVVAVDFLLRQGAWEYAEEEVLVSVPWSAVLAQHFDREVSSGSTRRVLLKLAALLHDISKPQTKAIDASGRTRFLGHAKEGAAIVASVLERLRFSAKEIKLVETIVRHHLRPGQLSQDGLPSGRAIYRYFRDVGEAGIDTLFLSLADHLATRGPHLNLSHWQEHARLVKYVLSQHFEQESTVRPPKLVDGHDIISILGVSPGPKIGETLEEVREAQASGEVTTRQEALSFIDRLLTSPHSLKGEKGQN